jgi:hypothetical protein
MQHPVPLPACLAQPRDTHGVHTQSICFWNGAMAMLRRALCLCHASKIVALLVAHHNMDNEGMTSKQNTK